MTPSMALAGALALAILLLLLVSELRRRHDRHVARGSAVNVRIQVQPLRRSCWPRRHKWRGVVTRDGRDVAVWWCDRCAKVKHAHKMRRTRHGALGRTEE